MIPFPSHHNWIALNDFDKYVTVWTCTRCGTKTRAQWCSQDQELNALSVRKSTCTAELRAEYDRFLLNQKQG